MIKNMERKGMLQRRLWSIACAFRGIVCLIRREPNAKIHAIATVVVLLAAFLRNIAAEQWLWLSLAIALVWISEAFNTTVEMVCDLIVGEQRHALVRIIKDVAAGGVLLAAGFALVVGYFVFMKG